VCVCVCVRVCAHVHAQKLSLKSFLMHYNTHWADWAIVKTHPGATTRGLSCVVVLCCCVVVLCCSTINYYRFT
jgi:hypothetical protein